MYGYCIWNQLLMFDFVSILQKMYGKINMIRLRIKFEAYFFPRHRVWIIFNTKILVCTTIRNKILLYRLIYCVSEGVNEYDLKQVLRDECLKRFRVVHLSYFILYCTFAGHQIYLLLFQNIYKEKIYVGIRIKLKTKTVY